MKNNPGTTPTAAASTALLSASKHARTSPTASARVATSLRLPVNEPNRARLRALRAAELATWERKPKANLEANARAARAMLRTQVAQLAQQKRQETLLYSTLACFSALAVGYALWDSLRLFESWPAFVQFVQRLVG